MAAAYDPEADAPSRITPLYPGAVNAALETPALPTPSQPPAAEAAQRDKVLPLPRWLTRVYYVFPVILYIPDGIFNFYVYTDGAKPPSGNPVVQAGFFALWTFVALGVVGMAYLLSVLAPWHWGQGHKVQALFCALGILVATGITTWNSLAYRSVTFSTFKTDQWIYNIWPQLRADGISITMILVAVAPPFWGLFWAIVQPTRTGRTLAQIQESHQEKLLRTQHEAELKSARAEANSRVRQAQLKGMAATAAAAKQSAGSIFSRQGKQPSQEPAAVEPALPAAAEEEPVAEPAVEQAAPTPPRHQRPRRRVAPAAEPVALEDDWRPREPSSPIGARKPAYVHEPGARLNQD
jgi:hypothetical protein